MYSIIHIPTGLPLTQIAFDRTDDEEFHRAFFEVMPLHGTTDFYSLKDSKRFIKNFVEYDKFQRRKPQDRADWVWLIRNNKFPFLQYRVLFMALTNTSVFDPTPDSVILEEFLIVKTKKYQRVWKIYRGLENLES